MPDLRPTQLDGSQDAIGVIGLGYVGLPIALSFAEAGLRVVGFDTDPAKVDDLRAGRSYLPHLNAGRIREQAAADRFAATVDHAQVARCQAVLICVPTPLDAHLQPDLRFVESTCRVIAPHLQPGTLVVLESTSWPGTTNDVVRPLIEAGSGLRCGDTCFVAFSPEREDPGNAEWSTTRIPRLVGGVDQASGQRARDLYARVLDQVILVDDARIAEAAKLLENIYRSVNIALVNELKVILDQMGIDVWPVIQAAATKPFGYAPFWPGPGLGGHCIPIDPFYLAWKARAHGVTTRFIELAGEINRGMPRWVVGKVQDCLNDAGKPLRGSRVLVIGLSYKPNIGDTRESASLVLMSQLRDKGAHVAYHDPFVPVVPPTRAHPSLAGIASVPITSDHDVILVATFHDVLDAEAILALGVPIVDTRRAFPPAHPLVYPG